jgi:hypothetical protein
LIVKFHSRGTGGGKGPVQYLLGKDGQRDLAKLLRGYPEQTAALIDSSLYAKKYTSGVLSFAESDLSDEVKHQIMDSFVGALMPGLDSDQFDCLWVEHRDKNRLELNFVIPNIELTSGKRLQPYYDPADRKRVNAWKVLTNAEHGLHDPDDPANQRSLTTANNLPRVHKEAAEAINQGVMALAESGVIRNRDDVLKALNDAGFEIARETKSSISIKNPVDGGKNIRLKGALYERLFRFGTGLQDEITRASSAYRQARTERIEHAQATLDHGIDKKRRDITKRYPRITAKFEPSTQPERAADKQLNTANAGAVVVENRGAEHGYKSRSYQELRSSDLGGNPDSVISKRGPLVSGSATGVSSAADRELADDIERIGESRLEAQTQQLRQSTVRTNGPERATVSGKLFDTRGLLKNDRVRTDAIERIRAAKRAAIAAAQRIRNRARELARELREFCSFSEQQSERIAADARKHLFYIEQNISRELTATRASELLKQSNQRLGATTERLDATFKSLKNRVVSVEKLREKQQRKGPSLGM